MHQRIKDDKRHIYYSLTESLRVSRQRVVERMHLRELNTTPVERTIQTVPEDGEGRHLRLLTERERQAPVAAQDIAGMFFLRRSFKYRCRSFARAPIIYRRI